MNRDYTLQELIDNVLLCSTYDIYEGQGSFAKSELAHITMEAIGLLGAWECFSCGIDTFALGEDFYVHNELWSTYGVEGMLCIGCLEGRLGRRLESTDFTGPHCSNGGENFPHYHRSERLTDRLGELAVSGEK